MASLFTETGFLVIQKALAHNPISVGSTPAVVCLTSCREGMSTRRDMA